ncbi:MAG: hypothetical protein CMI13_02355 [Oleibacter sp.]|nr:hypothetical protein [Thalassolituus sp.]
MLHIKVPKKNTPVPGTQFALRPAIGPTYEVFFLYLKNGLTLAHLKNIKVEVRGKPIWSLKDGEQLQALNAHYGRPLSDRADVLAFWFYRPEMQKIEERKNFALGTGDVDTLAIVMDIDAAAPQAGDIEIKARTTARRPLGVITKIKQYPQTFAQGGEQDIADIPTRDAAIAGLHLQTADVAAMRLELDSLKVVEGTTEELHDAYAEWVEAQTGFAHMSFIGRGSQYDALITEGVQDFRLTIDLDNAATFPLVVEYFDTYAGL